MPNLASKYPELSKIVDWARHDGRAYVNLNYVTLNTVALQELLDLFQEDEAEETVEPLVE